MTWPYQLFRSVLETSPEDPDCLIAAELAELSLHPPFPWGQILYGKILRERGDRLAGDIAECGVALGGMSLFLAQHARRLGKHVYAFDSFEGLPEPSPSHDNPYFQKGDYRPDRAIGDLRQRFGHEVRRRGLAEIVTTIPGFLEETLPTFCSPESFAFVHIDLDLYGPVLDALRFFYPRLVEGGILVIDDFFHHARGPARAAETFFGEQGLFPVYHVSFPYSVVIFKGERPDPTHRRSVDGNRYSLRLLRDLPSLQARVREVCSALPRGSADGKHAEMLQRLLQQDGDKSSDIYEYWLALGSYWDDMDAPETAARPKIEL